MDAQPFPYMRWAKTHLNAAWGAGNLGMSGAPPPTASEREAMGLPPPTEVGDPRGMLEEALAARYGVAVDQVYVTAGTSHANFAAFLGLARAGRVAAEAPTYEALQRIAGAVGADLATFARDPARRWRLDAGALGAAVGGDADLIAVTDLHNPSGMRLETADLDLLIDAAERSDAHVLVDEVYLEFDPADRPTAALRHPRVVTTNSLTKVHGLGELRCGWVLGAPEAIARIEAWDDLVHPVQPTAMLTAAAVYLPHADARVAAIRARGAACADQVDAWVARTPGVSWDKPDGGLTGVLRLGTADAPLDGDLVAAAAYEEHGVRVVPGSFFQMPDCVRISFLLEPDDLEAGLAGLGDAVAACVGVTS